MFTLYTFNIVQVLLGPGKILLEIGLGLPKRDPGRKRHSDGLERPDGDGYAFGPPALGEDDRPQGGDFKRDG